MLGAVIGLAVQIGVESTGALGPGIEDVITQQTEGFDRLESTLRELRGAREPARQKELQKEIRELVGGQRELAERTADELRGSRDEIRRLQAAALDAGQAALGADLWLKPGEGATIGSRDHVLSLLRFWDQQQGEVAEAGEFLGLLHKKAKIKDDTSKERADQAVRSLAEWALSDAKLVSDDAVSTIKAVISKIDAKLTEQVNLILHHADFQQLEGAWRGLNYLVSNTQSDEQLKIRVFNCSKAELGKSLKKHKGAMFDQSPIFKKVYTEQYGQWGGEPFGCLIGDYYFDQSGPDVELLGEMAKIGSAAHAPFLAAASPDILQMESFQELSNPVDLKRFFSDPQYAAWNSLRQTEDSKYIGLAMPRFLSRRPYGPKTEPVEEFEFVEETGSGDHNKYAWANAAYAMGTCITRAFKEYGWTTKIRGPEGGAVPELPVDTFPTDDGGTDMKCPTEIAIDNRREKELADCGFMPLVHKKNTDLAAFIGAQSLRQPVEYDDDDASANEQLAARLPYLFASCRFSHFLNKMVYDMIGSFTTRDEVQRMLQKWINQYVLADPDNAPQRARAERPLQKAEVVVTEDEANPGYYNAKFSIMPHYQLEGMTVSMSLVAKLPSEKG